MSHVYDLIAAITSYLDSPQRAPRPFVWTASADKVLREVRRAQDCVAK